MNGYIKRHMWFAMMLFGGLVLNCAVHAASFDCAKAGTQVEKLICDNPEISKFDEELNAAYKTALQDEKQDEKQAEAIKQVQKQWMKERNKCADADCLEMAYRGRTADLNPVRNSDRFIPVLTKDKPLCEAYKRYVEHEAATKYQYAHYASPMCQRNFGETFPEFTPVKWREIKPEDYPELSGQAYRYLNDWPWDALVENWPFKNRDDIAKPLSREWFEEGTKSAKFQYSIGWFHMWLGEADIGNAGHMETLLRVEEGRCGEESMTVRPPRWSIPVMVVDASGKKIDTAKSERVLGVSVLPNPATPPQNFTYIPGIHETGLESYDLFTRSGVTYFDRIKDAWVIIPYAKYDDRFATYSIYQVTREEPQLICRFKFKKQAN